jgi:hypothetical protein
VGTDEDAEGAKTALELMNARDIHVLSLSGLSIQKTVTKAVSVVDGDYVQEGGCVACWRNGDYCGGSGGQFYPTQIFQHRS